MSYEIKQKNPSSRIFRVNKLNPEKNMEFILGREIFFLQFFKVVFSGKQFFHKFHFLEKKKESIFGYFHPRNTLI